VGRRWWRALAEDVFGVLLFLAGCALLSLGLVDDRDTVVVIGAGILLAGAFSNRLRRAKVGPAGAEIELEQRARETTSQLALGPPPAAPGPFPLPDAEEVIDTHRVALANDVIGMLTAPRSGPLVGCSFQLYLPDAEEEQLLPVLQPGHPGPSPGFAVGEGVTGTAWATGALAIAEGVETSDETFSLSAEKQARYSDLAVVAAMPVTNAAGHVLAVLSAASDDPDTELRSEVGMEALVALAGAVARVLVDILKWFADDYDEDAGEGA
jgi:hypothetical protein